MAERDWSKELAKIDKHIGAMSGAESAKAGQPPAKPGEGATREAAAPAPKGKTPAPAAGPAGAFGAYARLTLSVLLGVAMVAWPYEARCGIGLAGYLVAVAAVIVSGGWSAVWTWRHRAARAHILSLLLVLWGLVLGSLEVLPRVGYAKPDAEHPAGWFCK